jgi:hypothetical protein
MANTFFRAMGLETGSSLVEDERVDLAAELISEAGEKLLLPTDLVLARSMDEPGETRSVRREEIPLVGPHSMWDPTRRRGTRVRSKLPGRCSGMARWAYSRSRPSAMVPRRSPTPS